MKMRVTCNERAQLVTREGTVIGSLAGLSFDFDMPQIAEAFGGPMGGKGQQSSNNTTTTPQPPIGEQTALIADAATEVWAHYQQVVPNAERRKFDTRRRRCIQRALDVRSVDECKRAITALSRSSFHLGNNEQKTAYLDIEYALGRRSDSPDAVIDKWLERSGGTGDVEAWKVKVNSLSEADKRRWVAWRKEVRMAIGSDYEPTLEIGRKALANIKRVVGIEPVVEDGKITTWRPVQ